MRILITIPHFYRTGSGPAPHGSMGSDPARRLAIVERCLATLHQTFGTAQRLCSEANGVMWPNSNDGLCTGLDVVVCTTGDHHLGRGLPRHLYVHCDTGADPRLLGFACQKILHDNLGTYDYYGYLEDDIEVADPLFFLKLAWFTGEFGAETLLQPNRFEADARLQPAKLYIDGNLRDPAMQAPFQDIAVQRHRSARLLGRDWHFQRTDNVHSGCFFLSPGQLQRAAASPEFARPSAAFIGPLESAATLMIMRNFAVYKPSRENAAFLEVRHLDHRHLLPPPGTAG